MRHTRGSRAVRVMARAARRASARRCTLTRGRSLATDQVFGARDEQPSLISSRPRFGRPRARTDETLVGANALVGEEVQRDDVVTYAHRAQASQRVRFERHVWTEAVVEILDAGAIVTAD